MAMDEKEDLPRQEPVRSESSELSERTMYRSLYDRSLRPPAKKRVSRGTKALRVVLGFLGFGTAIAAGIYAYNQEESVWLSVFVGLVALQLVGRRAADVITDAKKVRRALYFLLLPTLASASFYVAYQAWEKWWLAFVVGLLGGGILNAILAPLLFPGIRREEMADSRQRLRQEAVRSESSELRRPTRD